jgi:uncharacterized protein involved in outer membrane biogenesis
MRLLVRWFALTVVGLAGIVLATVTVMALLGLTIDLSRLRGGVEVSAEKMLGRDVQINGPVVLEFSGWPSIEVRDVTIDNAPWGRAEHLFEAGMARLEIRLLSLLKAELQIGEITAEQVTLNLENDAQGRANWVFGQEVALSSAEALDTQTETVIDHGEPPFSFVGLHELSLQQVAVNYHDAALGKTLTFSLDSLYGEAAPGQPITMQFSGHFQDDRYELELQGGSVDELLDPETTWPFTLSGDISDRRIDATGDLGLRNEIPVLGLALVVQELDVGAILSRLGLVEGMEATTREAGVDLILRGKTLNEIVHESRMTFAITDGQWTISDPNSQASLEISNLAGDIHVKGGAAITMNLGGDIEQTPVKFVIVGATLEEYFATPEELPFSIDVALLESRFIFDTKLALPISQHDLNFALSIEGKRLDHFNGLLDLDFPPLGPFMLDARLNVSREGYDLSTLDVTVGKSQLEGRLRLNTALDKPKLDVELLSKLIRVEDFYFPESAKAAADEGREEGATVEQAGEDNGRELISHEVLNKLDADIHVEARRVTSGADELGSGNLTVTLKDGRLAVEPLRIDTLGGGIQMGFSLHPGEQNFIMTVDASIDHFDYGIMARLVDSETDMSGVMSLDIEFNSTAPDSAAIMANATGHFDFALFPGSFSAEVFDLWAVNMISEIATEVDKDEESAVNCIVVRLGLESGRMQERVIFMDTTRMSVAGKVDVDFNTRTIDILAAPKAKKAEFFSLATPVKVQGSFEDFSLGVNPLQLTRSVFSFVSSPLHVPIRRVFKKEIPADGKAACELAWEKTADEIIKEQSE